MNDMYCMYFRASIKTLIADEHNEVYRVFYETIHEAFTFSVSPERRQSQVSASRLCIDS